MFIPLVGYSYYDDDSDEKVIIAFTSTKIFLLVTSTSLAKAQKMK